METTKEDMSRYLEKVQKLQCVTIGMHDMTIDMLTLQDGGEVSITAIIYPVDETFHRIVSHTGSVCYEYRFKEWCSREENEQTLAELRDRLRKLSVL